MTTAPDVLFGDDAAERCVQFAVIQVLLSSDQLLRQLVDLGLRLRQLRLA